MAKKISTPDTILIDVRFSDLGRAIQGFQEYLPAIEQLLKVMHQNNDENAKTLEYMLGATDWLSHCYQEVE